MDKRENFLTAEFGPRTCALNRSVRVVKFTAESEVYLRTHIPNFVKFVQNFRALEIIDCAGFDAIRAIQTHLRIYGHNLKKIILYSVQFHA